MSPTRTRAPIIIEGVLDRLGAEQQLNLQPESSPGWREGGKGCGFFTIRNGPMVAVWGMSDASGMKAKILFPDEIKERVDMAIRRTKEGLVSKK